MTNKPRINLGRSGYTLPAPTCPQCSHPKSYITNTRNASINDQPTISRTRRCAQCDDRWDTLEIRLDEIKEVLLTVRRAALRGVCADLGLNKTGVELLVRCLEDTQ